MAKPNYKNPIPVIDLSTFKASGFSEYRRLREACEAWGCFRIVNHGVPHDLMAEMKTTVRSLLDLPEDIKRRNTDVIPGSGYLAPSAANPLYESLGLYDLASSEALRKFCDELDATPRQRETIEKYAKAVHELTMEIGQKVARSVGVESGLFRGWSSQFRINKYSFTPESVGSSGVQIHTDSGFLTILQEDENVRGLEVMDRKGQFVAVDPCPGTLLLNLGDVAKVWSNGRFCNVKHRVQCKEAAIRVSIASIIFGPKESDVEAPSELVDEEHPRLYLPFSYEDYRKLRISAKLHDGEALELLRA